MSSGDWVLGLGGTLVPEGPQVDGEEVSITDMGLKLAEEILFMSRLFFLAPLSKQEATKSIRVFPKESICMVCTSFFFLNLFFTFPFALVLCKLKSLLH